jgi:hypothetical protein
MNTQFPLCALVCWLATAQVWGHQASTAYLTLAVQGQTLHAQWDIALRDLESAVGLDANDDGLLTWAEVRARHAEVAAYALAQLRLVADGTRVSLRVTEQLVAQHDDGGYAVLRMTADMPAAPTELSIEYHLFATLDPLHRGLFQLRCGANTQTGVFGPERAVQTFALTPAAPFAPWLHFVGEGVHHIWVGYDHILFLLALLLPAVLVWAGRRDGSPGVAFTSGNAQSWLPTPAFRPAFLNVAKVVTAFTVAHSLTLSLAALDLMRVPSRWVERCIAASVVAAALNNLRPWFRAQAWLLAFAFGLVHGFGFASVLGALELPRSALAVSLLGFNLGVELGQLTLVAVCFPLAYAARQTWFYRRVVLQFGSAGIALLAGAWLIERGFDLRLLPF